MREFPKTGSAAGLWAGVFYTFIFEPEIQRHRLMNKPRKTMTDFHRVDERHRDIDQRLDRWGRWITRNPKAWKVLPMFAQYRSHAWQWETPEVFAPDTPADHWEIEHAVSLLPERHRTAIRWAYAWPWVPLRAVRQHLGLTGTDLQGMLVDGRDMLVNRMR